MEGGGAMHAQPRATLRRLSRRDFLRLVASGAGVMSISALAGYPTAPAEAAAAPAATHAPAPTTQPAAAGAPIVFNNPNASQASPVVVSQQGGKLIYGSGGALEQSDPM